MQERSQNREKKSGLRDKYAKAGRRGAYVASGRYSDSLVQRDGAISKARLSTYCEKGTSMLSG